LGSHNLQIKRSNLVLIIGESSIGAFLLTILLQLYPCCYYLTLSLYSRLNAAPVVVAMVLWSLPLLHFARESSLSLETLFI
jgi:hypothetical protein